MKIVAVASDGELWVSKALSTIQTLESDSKHVSLLSDADGNELALRAQALDMAAQLKTVSEVYLRGGRDIHCPQVSQEPHESAKGAELLLLATVLQQYCQEPEDVDSDVLEVRCPESLRRVSFILA